MDYHDKQELTFMFIVVWITFLVASAAVESFLFGFLFIFIIAGIPILFMKMLEWFENRKHKTL